MDRQRAPGLNPHNPDLPSNIQSTIAAAPSQSDPVAVYRTRSLCANQDKEGQVFAQPFKNINQLEGKYCHST